MLWTTGLLYAYLASAFGLRIASTAVNLNSAGPQPLHQIGAQNYVSYLYNTSFLVKKIHKLVTKTANFFLES